MPASAAALTNSERRAQVHSLVEARLLEIWPDEEPTAPKAYACFDELEAVAARTGDELARELMEAALAKELRLPGGEKAERCAECGRKLQYARKSRTIVTIRGPVTFERDHAYCRGCRKGFFPR